jgi:predicted DNA-binding transcriptional regulator AlpA
MKPEPLRQTTSIPPRYGRMGTLCAYLGISNATGWRRVQDDPSFPQPIKVSDGVTLFDLRDADLYVASKRAALVPVQEYAQSVTASRQEALRR